MYNPLFRCIVLFQTKNKINDYTSDDMQHSDLSESELIELGLNDVSTRVEPYRMILTENSKKYSEHPFSSEYDSKPASDKPIEKDECSDILFEEMRELSGIFASGQYKKLIGEMITHFKYRNGQNFSDNALLNKAYEDLLMSKLYGDTTLGAIRAVINKFSQNRPQQIGSSDFIYEVQRQIANVRLPKFDDFEDRFNGMGITVHDIHFQRIILYNFVRSKIGWSAEIAFEAQDHFGLGREDITKKLFHSFRFFRIWFVLQRYDAFKFKPFMTNFHARIKISG